MRVLELIVLAFAPIATAGLATPIAHAQTPPIDCSHFSKASNDDAPFAVYLKDLAPKQPDPLQAEDACRSALKSDPANPTILFQLGRALSVAGKHREAMKYYLDAADRAHAGAMNDLGGLFEYGLGVPKNVVTALVWYERAAGLAHTGAMTHLGRLSEIGADVPQDFAEARRWYEQAAALGSAASMSLVADLFRSGRAWSRIKPLPRAGTSRRRSLAMPAP